MYMYKIQYRNKRMPVVRNYCIYYVIFILINTHTNWGLECLMEFYMVVVSRELNVGFQLQIYLHGLHVHVWYLTTRYNLILPVIYTSRRIVQCTRVHCGHTLTRVESYKITYPSSHFLILLEGNFSINKWSFKFSISSYTTLSPYQYSEDLHFKDH